MTTTEKIKAIIDAWEAAGAEPPRVLVDAHRELTVLDAIRVNRRPHIIVVDAKTLESVDLEKSSVPERFLLGIEGGYADISRVYGRIKDDGKNTPGGVA